jgi:hypothetical protein
MQPCERGELRLYRPAPVERPPLPCQLARAYADKGELDSQHSSKTPRTTGTCMQTARSPWRTWAHGRGDREARRGLESSGRDAPAHPAMRGAPARIYLLVGEPEQALDELEALLKMPYYVTRPGCGFTPTSPHSRAIHGSSSCSRGRKRRSPGELQGL